MTATGMDTEIGRIAHLLQEKESSETPLQKRLQQLGRILVLACAAIVAVVFAAGVGQGLPVYKMFMVAVTLAVAAIPEGLPAVVTIALSVGVQRMSRQSAVIRQLPAVETLVRHRDLFRQNGHPHPQPDGGAAALDRPGFAQPGRAGAQAGSPNPG